MPSNAFWLRKKFEGSGSSGPGNNIGGGSGRGVEDFDFVDLRFLVALEDGRLAEATSKRLKRLFLFVLFFELIADA